MDATLHMPSRFALYGVLLCDISHEYLVATYIARYVSYVPTCCLQKALILHVLIPCSFISRYWGSLRPHPDCIHGCTWKENWKCSSNEGMYKYPLHSYIIVHHLTPTHFYCCYGNEWLLGVLSSYVTEYCNWTQTVRRHDIKNEIAVYVWVDWD